jgi:hypothetical protein
MRTANLNFHFLSSQSTWKNNSVLTEWQTQTLGCIPLTFPEAVKYSGMKKNVASAESQHRSLWFSCRNHQETWQDGKMQESEA